MTITPERTGPSGAEERPNFPTENPSDSPTTELDSELNKSEDEVPYKPGLDPTHPDHKDYVASLRGEEVVVSGKITHFMSRLGLLTKYFESENDDKKKINRVRATMVGVTSGIAEYSVRQDEDSESISYFSFSSYIKVEKIE